MTIWHDQPSSEAINRLHEGTIVSLLGIEIVEFGDDFIRATMPVDQRTLQPFGLLHGGASVVLAETVASVAGNQVVDNDQFQCVGTAVTANHLRSVRDGLVTAVGHPTHLGRTSQVWDVDLHDGRDRAVAVCRITLTVIPR